MRKTFVFFAILFISMNLSGQQPAQKANYQLAARYAPKKLDRMIFTTSVDPHWLKQSDRFWYVFETPNGKNWYIVDPAAGSKRLLFDNAKLAAELTRIIRDPFDAQHLTIDSMRFVKDENWIQFEVLSTEEIEVKDTTAKKGAPPKKERKR